MKATRRRPLQSTRAWRTTRGTGRGTPGERRENDLSAEVVGRSPRCRSPYRGTCRERTTNQTPSPAQKHHRRCQVMYLPQGVRRGSISHCRKRKVRRGTPPHDHLGRGGRHSEARRSLGHSGLPEGPRCGSGGLSDRVRPAAESPYRSSRASRPAGGARAWGSPRCGASRSMRSAGGAQQAADVDPERDGVPVADGRPDDRVDPQRLRAGVVSVEGTTAVVQDCLYSTVVLVYKATGQPYPDQPGGTQPEWDLVTATMTDASGSWQLESSQEVFGSSCRPASPSP